MKKILLLENISQVAKSRLEEEGFSVDLLNYAPGEEELISLLKDYDGVGLRSKTKLTKKVLEASSHLMVVGCFCIGTNQVDLKMAKELGIPVFNAPHSNTRSVAELVLCEIIALSRRLGDMNNSCHLGAWPKSAEGSHEVRGKTLGIVGYGHIGSQVSVLAESLGLHVIFYDVSKKLPLGNARSMGSLDELLQNSDFVTLHVPLLPETEGMIGERELKKMKEGSYLINASRGNVVVIEALAKALALKHLSGAAIDVYPKEPASTKDKFTSPLQNLSNVILTPHVGGSTEEAQTSIGYEVSESFIKYIKIGSTEGAVNFPNVDLPVKHDSSRLLNVHFNKPGILSEINNIISHYEVNIAAQFLSTDETVGYIVIDMESKETEKLALEISKLSRSIKTRVVY